MNEIKSKLLTTKEAAAFLNVSVSFLQKDRLRQCFSVPFVRMGKKRGLIRYSTDSINELLRKKDQEGAVQFSIEVAS